MCFQWVKTESQLIHDTQNPRNVCISLSSNKISYYFELFKLSEDMSSWMINVKLVKYLINHCFLLATNIYFLNLYTILKEI